MLEEEEVAKALVVLVVMRSLFAVGAGGVGLGGCMLVLGMVPDRRKSAIGNLRDIFIC